MRALENRLALVAVCALIAASSACSPNSTASGTAGAGTSHASISSSAGSAAPTGGFSTANSTSGSGNAASSGSSFSGSGSSSVGSGGSAVSSGAGGSGGAPLTFACTPVANGSGAVSVNGGLARSYYVDLPASTSAPMALLFSWHGYKQAPVDFKNAIGFDPNGASMPIVVVTPTDTGLFLQQIPSGGLDWDIEGSNSNVDFPYFQGMLSCLKDQFPIDDTRVYSFGFSAGAVFTNLLASQWPHLFAATVSESGAWFSDTAEKAATDGVGLFYPWTWPALNPADQGSVLMTHGGTNDYATIISIEVADQFALPFLLGAKRTVVDCAHTAGHAIDPQVTNAMIYEYLLSHQLGQPSPFQGGTALFPDMASAGCTLHVPM